MYRIGNVVLFDGKDWSEGDFGAETVSSLLARAMELFITATDEAGNFFLITKDEMKLYTPSLPLLTAINRNYLTNKVKENVKLKQYGYEFVPISEIDALSVICPKPMPFVFNNNCCISTEVWGDRTAVPDLLKEMAFSEDYSVGTIRGIGDAIPMDFSWTMSSTDFNSCLIKIGDKLAALRQLFDLCGTELKLKPNYRSWFVDLFRSTLERIPASDVGVSYPLNLNHVVNKETIIRYFNHRQVKLFKINCEHPVTLSKNPISKYSSELTDGIIFEGDCPTTHRVIGFKYHNELVKHKRYLPDDTYKTKSGALIGTPDVILAEPEYSLRHLVLLDLPEQV